MALVNIASIIADTEHAMKQLAPPGGVALLSYKRNRSIAVIKQSSGNFRLRERGYHEQELEISPLHLARELKTMIKREFPRSRKIRLCKFSDQGELDKPRQKI